MKSSTLYASIAVFLYASPTLLLSQEDSEARAEYQALVSEFNEYRRANASSRELLENAGPVFAPRFLAAAQRYERSEGAVQFLTWIIVYGAEDPAAVTKALAAMLDHHIASKAWATVARPLATLQTVLDPETAREVIDRVVSENPHPEVKGSILYARCHQVLRDGYRGDVPEPIRDQAITELKQVIALMPDQELAQHAAGALFEFERLQNGMEAPEIVAEDLDGAKFRLSDYRGRVVMLTFWGDWCGPCRAMYPYERQLVEEFKGAPFALIGVNSDPNIERLKERVEEEALNWRNLWNGPEGTDGPISESWNIWAWPTIYFIDHKGVIRARNKPPDAMADTVRQLLSEIGIDY